MPGLGSYTTSEVGGCKIVSDLVAQKGALLSVQLKIPEQTTPITIRAVTVQWILELEFGVEFLEMQELERVRLEQFLATQVNIVP